MPKLREGSPAFHRRQARLSRKEASKAAGSERRTEKASILVDRKERVIVATRGLLTLWGVRHTGRYK